MGRSKSTGPAPAAGNHAKERHRRDRKGNFWDWNKTPPPGLIATLDKPQVKFKHRVELEFVENTNRKKKLEFEFYKSRDPPPLFEFVPIGKPAFTDLCKEISRERGAMIYIVAPLYHGDSKQLSVHTHRIGHHFRQAIVEEARQQLPDPIDVDLVPGEPEPIPETQAEINEQAEKHIMELFPRIPNTDRQVILDRAFNLARRNDRDPPVGLARDIPLTSRVQLAVLAHIRHTHTRYDQLLRETDWASARKVVEPVCLDILVKWRGDEESGRDQLEEILREVIYINSDTESDDDDDDDDEDDSETDVELSDSPSALVPPGEPVEVEGGLNKPTAVPVRHRTAPLNPPKENAVLRQPRAAQKVKKKKKKRGAKRKNKKHQRGLSRYQAAWEEAKERQRCEEANVQAQSPAALPTAMTRAASYGSRLPEYVSYPAFRDLGAPANYRAVLRYDDPPPTRLPVTTYYHQGLHSEAAPYYDEVKPIVRSPVIRDAGITVRRARHFGEDLKDHLVKSIEPTSPDVPSFPPQPLGEPRWEHDRIRSAPEVQYDRGYEASAGISGLHRHPEYVEPHPRDQVLVSTGFSPQPIVSVSSHPPTFGRTFATQGPSFAPGTAFPAYRPIPSAAPTGSGFRAEPPSVIWIDDDDGDDALPRTKARPIVIQDDFGEAQQVMVDTRPPQTARAAPEAQYYGSDRLDVHRTRGAERRVEPVGYDMSRDFSEIVRVSNKFPRRHEPQQYSAEAGGSARRSPAPLYYHQEGFRDDSALPPPSHLLPRQRVERVIARIEEPLRHHPYQMDTSRQPMGVSVGVHRQERVVGLEYVSTAAHDGGVRRFTSPAFRTEAGGDGHWSRPASVMPSSPNPNPNSNPNHRLASGRDYRRDDGVIELN